MAHFSSRDQFGPERPFLCNAEVVIDWLTDESCIDTTGPTLANEMFDATHQAFLVHQYAQEDLPFEGDTGLANGLDGLYRSG